MQKDSDPDKSSSFPADRLFNMLARAPYMSLGVLWEEAVDRVDADPNGALIAARRLLEATCRQVLDRTSHEISPSADLATLYNHASQALSVASSQQTQQTYKALFGAIYTIVQSVGELDNASGDAQGKPSHAYVSSISEAELAVNLTGTVCIFLLSALESYLTLNERIGSDGHVFLRFDKTGVWRIFDHSRNSPKSLPFYEIDTGPALWLVGDKGIYLMSNGNPRLGFDGLNIPQGREREIRSLTVHANGCDPDIVDFELWWKVHCAINDGSDFCYPLECGLFEDVLEHSDTEIVIVVGEDDIAIHSDREFRATFGDPALS